MAPTRQRQSHRRAETVVLALLAGLIVTACGASASKHRASVATSAYAASLAPAAAVIVQVGATPIKGATYDHWMAIGAATVELPKPGRPLPKPVAYEPPDFNACVAYLQPTAPKSTTTAQLKATCKKTYEGIQMRILNFLITGYWIRGEAAEQGASVSEAEVRKTFEEEKRTHYPSTASFRRLLEASHQTVPDLMFAVKTQMLSAKLLEGFTKAHPHETSEQATIGAFNKSIRGTWTLRTNCQPGYVVKDCRQHKP